MNALQSYIADPRRLHFITMLSWEINLKAGTQISEHLPQSACTQNGITNDETIKERQQKKEHFVHGSSQRMHIGITMTDANKG
jgi:hypothetical protein